MKALRLALALWLASFGLSYALTPAQWILLFGNNPCAHVTLSAHFGDGRTSCYKGAAYTSPTSLPGWSYSGSVSGTGATVRTATDKNGNVYNFANGFPRITNQGLLVEGAATNLLLQSNAFTTTPWSSVSAALTNAAATAPDGTSTGWSLALTAATYGSIYQSNAVTNGSAYTLSVYAKASTSTQFTIESRYGSQAYDALFTLSGTGTASINVSAIGAPTATITALNNGWYRCTVTKTSIATTVINIIGYGTSPSSGASVYIWGGQFELGGFASSYIPTTSAAVTRNADNPVSVTFTGSPSKAVVTYSGNLTVTTNNPTSPFALGSASGGAWVGEYVKSLVIQ